MPNTSSKHKLEIACFDIKSCNMAQEAGADRIEFCADYKSGGVTPSHNNIIEARKILQIPLHIIIRPRGGNFMYTHNELQQMQKDILFCKAQGVNGVVVGVLTNDHKIDVEANRNLVNLAQGMNVTFHRAIDECENMHIAFQQLIDLGFTHVLTSGGKGNAIENVSSLKNLQTQFGTKIHIIAGGGVRSHNVEHLLNQTHCTQFHSAALTNNENLVDISEVKFLKQKLI